MFDIDLTFQHLYEVEEISELPGDGRFNVPVHFFPGSKTRPEHDGLWTMIRPTNAPSWVGVFGFAFESAPALSRVVSLPNPNRLCVISKGAGYFVDVRNPATWENADLMPITDIRSIPDSGLVVFADFIRLTAVGKDGIVWQSPRLCWDDLKIQKMSHDRIEGVGYDPTHSDRSEMPFAVELATGRSLYPTPRSLEDKPVG